jgi:hypothetical protein
MYRHSFFLLIGFVLLCVSTSLAEVPQTINYQGHLASSGGSPVNAAVDMTFTIYDAATNGTVLWTEDQTVQVNNGIYAVALGAINTIDQAIVDDELWLGVKVGTDAEMTPRHKLQSVPFAMKAQALASGPMLDSFNILKLRALGDYSYVVENMDGTITDPLTGLIWLKNAISGPTGYNWFQASGNYDSTYNPNSTDVCGEYFFAGYDDWRLPDLYDAKSLFQTGVFSIRDSRYFPFTNLVGANYMGFFWLQTTRDATRSYLAGMGGYTSLIDNDPPGFSYSNDSDSNIRVICVR